MATTNYYINIICDAGERPYLVIVTDGDQAWEIPVTNTPLRTVRKQMRAMYNPREILVSIIMGDADDVTPKH